MTVYAITDTKKGRTGIAPTYLQTTLIFIFRIIIFILGRGRAPTQTLPPVFDAITGRRKIAHDLSKCPSGSHGK